jgi:hypothetical protein
MGRRRPSYLPKCADRTTEVSRRRGVAQEVDCRAELADRSTFDTRYFICSAPIDLDRIANGVRGHRPSCMR